MTHQQLCVAQIVFFLFVSTHLYSLHASISPAYFFANSNNIPDNTSNPLSFTQINLNTGVQNVLNVIPFLNDEYSSIFYGLSIYYQTGVMFATYTKLISPQPLYQSYLLAIDTSSGKLLFKDRQICIGQITGGISIDQTNGNLHFLNHSQTDSSPYTGGRVDWGYWNVNNNITTMLVFNANSAAYFYGNIVFNSHTQVLWSLQATSLIAYYHTPENSHITVYPLDRLIISITINPQNGLLYLIGWGESGYIEEVNTTSSGIEWYVEWCSFPGDAKSFNVKPYAADYDYQSNNLMIALNGLVMGSSSPKTVIYSIDLSTCAWSQIDFNDNFNLGSPRYNSG